MTQTIAELKYDPDELGYDPKPEVKDWRNTPIPRVLHPLKMTKARERIADRVWCNGPPWTVLRNAYVYLFHVADIANDADLKFTRKDVPDELWRGAIKIAKPGDLSAGAYVLEGLRLGIFKPPFLCTWPAKAHFRDVRPMANASRELLYRIHKVYVEGLIQDRIDAGQTLDDQF